MWKLHLAILAAVFVVGSGAKMVGGYTDIDANDEGVQNALNFAVVEHNRGTNDMYLRQVTEVVKAERQLVAGYNYRLTVKMARTTCKRDSANEVCPVHTDPTLAQSYKCTFVVWVKPWQNYISLQSQTC